MGAARPGNRKRRASSTALRAVLAAAVPLLASAGMADEPAAQPEKAGAEKSAAPTCPGDDPKAKEVPAPKPAQALTHHRLAIGGSTVEYTATAGTLILRSEEDKPTASIGY